MKTLLFIPLLFITILCYSQSKLAVPNAFTPNNDNVNDRFKIVNLTSEKILDFCVFNRSGRLIYRSTDNSGWDGSYNGILQDMGSYYYQIRYTSNDSLYMLKGNVILIR